MSGQVIDGRYRLTKLLGKGGMGEVYIGEHIRITKKVAIKFLHHEISGDPEALGRFQQEAQSASSIGHRNIVTIDDFGTMDDGRVFLCMEFLAGQSMSEAMMAPSGLETIRALDLMIQVCDGLHAAHAKGIVHRDMKPENVFITQPTDMPELVKVLDFGIAKVASNDEQNLTKTGTVFGTPHYMSPEQALGQKDKIDARSDVYSLGVMLFEIFTGELPFKAESFMGILSQHITKSPPVPATVTSRNIPPQVEEVILKAMAKDQDQRYANALELREALAAARGSLATGAAAVPPAPSVPPAAAGANGTSPTVAGGPVEAAPMVQGGPPSIPPTVAGLQTGPGYPGQVQPQTGPEMQPPVAPSGGYPGPGVPVSAPPANTVVPPATKGGGGLIIGLVVVVLVLLGGGGAAAYFLGWIPGTGGSRTSGDKVASLDDGDEKADEEKSAGDDDPDEEGDEAEKKAGDEAEKKTGDEAEKKTGDETEKKTGDEAEKKTGDVPEKKTGDVPEKKTGDVPEKKTAPATAKPWQKKGPALAGMDRGVGLSTLLDSCRLHYEGGNWSWAEAACLAGIKKGTASKDRRLPQLFYRLGRVYERRRRSGDALLAYSESARLGYGAAKKQVKRLKAKLGK